MLRWWTDLLTAIASGLVIAGAFIGVVAGFVRFFRKRHK